MITIYYEWPTYKTYIDGTAKTLSGQHIETPQAYDIFALDSSIRYTTTIYKAGYEPIGWSSQQMTDNATYRADFLDNFIANSNKKISSELTKTEKNNLELEMGFIASKSDNFTKLTYTGSTLTKIEIFEDNTMAVKLLQKDLTYAGGQLTQVVITRTSDSATLTKTLTYAGSALDTVDRS